MRVLHLAAPLFIAPFSSPPTHFLVTTGLDPVVHADAQQTKGRHVRARQFAPWIAGPLPAEGHGVRERSHSAATARRRVKPGKDEQKQSRDAFASEVCNGTDETVPHSEGSGAPTGAPSLPASADAGARPAGRARLSALHRGSRQGFYPLAQPRPRFLCAGSVPCWAPRASVQRAPRGPVIMPDGRSSGPPGSRVTSPARERRTCSDQRPSPVDVPH